MTQKRRNENMITEIEDPIETCDLICTDCVHTECEHYIDSLELDRDEIDLLNTRRAP